MGNELILSICIPTYNMGYKVVNTIDYLLQSPDERFNIVVLDNCSTDNSFQLLKQKESERVVIMQNEKNLGPSLNYIGALRISNSKFCLTLLDKDNLDIKFLPEFIDFLEKEKELYGYCVLNYDKGGKHEFIKWRKGFESVDATAYLSKHPTGYFYDTNILKQSLQETYYQNMDNSIPFPYEIINAHLGVKYNSCKVKLPLCYPEPREHNTTKSMSYTEDNLFYAPKRRKVEYSNYINDVLTLDLDKLQIFKIIEKLYVRFLSAVSIGYNQSMNDAFLCNHYNVAMRRVSIYEQIKYSRTITNITKKLLKKHMPYMRQLIMTEKLFLINALHIVKLSI